MREFISNFDMTKGLLAFDTLRDEKRGFEEILNLYSSEGMLKRHQAINFFAEALQIFRLRDWVVAISSTVIYFYDKNFNLRHIDSHVGEFWSFADYGDWWLLSNGIDFFYPDLDDPDLIIKNDEYEDFPPCRTFCDWNGQLFCGGMYNNWKGIGEYGVALSDIGSASFELSIINEAGWYNKKSMVVRLLPHQEGVYVFTEDDVWLMTPAEVHFQTLLVGEVGLKSPRAVASDGKQIIYLGKDGELKTIVDRKMSRLGYKKYMGTNPRFSWETDGEQRFFLTFNEGTFVLTRDGLFGISDRVEDTIRSGEAQLYVGNSWGPADEVVFETAPFVGQRSMKMVRQVTVSGVILGELTMFPIVRYYTSSDHGWRRLPGKNFVHGASYAEAAGDEIKIRVEGKCYSSEVKRLQMHVYYNDRRSIRGIDQELATAARNSGEEG